MGIPDRIPDASNGIAVGSLYLYVKKQRIAIITGTEYKMFCQNEIVQMFALVTHNVVVTTVIASKSAMLESFFFSMIIFLVNILVV